MKRIIIMIAIVVMSNVGGCLAAKAQGRVKQEVEQNEPYNMKITINGRTMKATMTANSSTKALKALLEQGSLTFTANDYGGFEKVGGIGHTLPQNNEQIETEPGDIILYMGSSICLYYAENSWNFTRLGKIDYSTESELREFLRAGGGAVEVTLTLDAAVTTVESVDAALEAQQMIYNLEGKAVEPHMARNGIFIIDGKKVKL